MEIFEIHITGDKSILDHGKKLSLKTISIDLVRPDKSYYRTKHMTSHVHSCETYYDCKRYVDKIVEQLKNYGVEIKRIKIECPFYKHYEGMSLYLEVHEESESGEYPLSINQGKNYYLSTEREYDKYKYRDLLAKHSKSEEDKTIELCLHDTNIEEDKDWFDLYKRKI
jgi:hypothetical protein